MSLATTTPQPQNAGTGLVTKSGQPMPLSPSYLQAQQEAVRHATLDKAWKHYRGDLSGHIRTEPGQPDPNVISNRASTIVDTGVDFLYGKTVRLEVLKNGQPQPDAQTALDGCWGTENRRMVLMSKLAQNGGIFGHVFAKILPPSPNPRDGRPYCRVVPLDPAQVSVVTDDDDCDSVRAYVIDWNIANPYNPHQGIVGKRQVIMRRDPDDSSGSDENNDADNTSYDDDATWEISNWVRGSNNTWYQQGQPMVWPHQWAPVCDWQNLPLANEHWGMSDIPQNVQHLNSVLNLTLSNINLIAKHYSFPYLYATGIAPDAFLEMKPGSLPKFHNPEAGIHSVDARGDIAGLMEFAQDLRSDMDEQTRVPSVATGRMRDIPAVTSGVAFQMMYGPLLSKNVHKQRLYGEGHEQLSLRMLALCGYGDGTGLDGWEVVTRWPSPLPNDDASTAQLLTAAQSAGMSQHFLCSLLEQDYDQEQEYKRQEAADALTAFAHGQGMPPMPQQPPANTSGGTIASSQLTDEQSGVAPNGQQPPQHQPPTNHPAAVAQRQATAAVAQVMKGGMR